MCLIITLQYYTVFSITRDYIVLIFLLQQISHCHEEVTTFQINASDRTRNSHEVSIFIVEPQHKTSTFFLVLAIKLANWKFLFL